MRVNRPKIFANKNKINITKLKDLEKEHRFPPILTDQHKVKNIKRIESVVRGSLEYREYIKYLVNHMNMDKCHFLPKVKKQDGRRISVEIHHEPFTLYDITQIVFEKHEREGRDINHFLIAEEVMKLHYMNQVGLIPLSATVHQLVHDGKIFIPVQDVYGKGFIDFINEYDISDELRTVLFDKIQMSREIEQDDNLSILERQYEYISIDGIDYPSLENFMEKEQA